MAKCNICHLNYKMDKRLYFTSPTVLAGIVDQIPIVKNHGVSSQWGRNKQYKCLLYLNALQAQGVCCIFSLSYATQTIPV